jgi:hypothetical protein
MLPQLIILGIHGINVALNISNLLLELVYLIVQNLVVLVHRHLAVNQSTRCLLHFLIVLVIQLGKLTED